MVYIRKCVYSVLLVNSFFLIRHLGVSFNDVRHTKKGNNNNNNKTAFRTYRKKEVNDFFRTLIILIRTSEKYMNRFTSLP